MFSKDDTMVVSHSLIFSLSLKTRAINWLLNIKMTIHFKNVSLKDYIEALSDTFTPKLILVKIIPIKVTSATMVSAKSAGIFDI